jgi:aspartyl-tRNA(Asn)/glutamyl-tRNA(Gln) amidotransferase subunit C
MKITREEVLHVAELAHLELTEDEIEAFGRHLDSILTYSSKLNELDTEGIEPMAQVVPPGTDEQNFAQASPSGTPLREDVPEPCEIIGDVLAGAPDPDPPYFLVPKVIER